MIKRTEIEVNNKIYEVYIRGIPSKQSIQYYIRIEQTPFLYMGVSTTLENVREEEFENIFLAFAIQFNTDTMLQEELYASIHDKTIEDLIETDLAKQQLRIIDGNMLDIFKAEYI